MLLEVIKSKRSQISYSCRDLAFKLKMKPSVWNRIENGLEPLPKGDAFLFQLASALLIERGSTEWESFISSCRTYTPPTRKPLTEKELVEKLPMVFRKKDGSAMKEPELTELAEELRRELA